MVREHKPAHQRLKQKIAKRVEGKVYIVETSEKELDRDIRKTIEIHLETTGEKIAHVIYIIQYQKNSVYIHEIYVREDYRRKGIARTLITHVIKSIIEEEPHIEKAVADITSNLGLRLIKSLEGWEFKREYHKGEHKIFTKEL